jgi:hypothetical protein
MLKSTPLWPISEKKKGINHSLLLKNVCNTLPAFIHNKSRQGEEWPAKGKITAFQIMGVRQKSISLDKRMLVFESMGDRQTVILLPRCRMMVGSLKPERPHFFFRGVKTIGAGWMNSLRFPHRKGGLSRIDPSAFKKAGLNGFG